MMLREKWWYDLENPLIIPLWQQKREVSNMEQILITATGFFAMIFLGYTLKRVGLFKLEDKDILGKLLLNICLPAVIIMSFQTFDFDISLMVAFFIALTVNFTAIFVGYFFSKKCEKEEQALFMFFTAGYNIGIFTIPFVSSFFAASSVLAVLMFDVGNAIFVMGITGAIVGGILNHERGNPLPQILKKMSKSPCILSYVVMLSFVFLGIPVPSIVFSVVQVPANATSFLAMIMVGIMLEFKINPQEKKELFSVLGLRYGYSFAVCCIIYYFLPFEQELRKALMIGVLSPMSTASVVYAQNFGCKPSIIGGASTFSILLSMIFIVSVALFIH